MRVTHLHRATPFLSCTEVGALILLPQPAASHQSTFISKNVLSTYSVLGIRDASVGEKKAKSLYLRSLQSIGERQTVNK